MNESDIERKRSILFSARIRFSPQSQPLRETIIDRIIEQNILIMDAGEGVSLKEIEKQNILCSSDSSAINLPEIEKSIKRLFKNKRIYKIENNKQQKYKLDKNIQEELYAEQQLTEKRIKRIIQKLFINKTIEYQKYYDPFLDTLCYIFAKLGETYVKILKGDATPDELLNLPIILNSISHISNKYPQIDQSILKTSLFTFFQEINPDFNSLKWNLAQNYYIIKILGIDHEGHLLSKEIFGNSIFYLDTNVLIHALEPKARHHQSFKTLCNAFKKLNIQLKVCNISIEELQNVVEDRRRTIEKVAEQIPEEISRKINGIFYQLYLEERAKTNEVDFNKLFSSFDNPTELLAKDYEVELIDEIWFSDAENDEETKQICNLMKNEHQIKRRRPKRKAAALHDTLLLRWISLNRKSTSHRIWLVTLDTFLPGFQVNKFDTKGRPIAITLDALLQWICPITINGDSEDKVSSIFSEALKFQLLPQDNFFDLRDFLVFAEMQWSCKELPVEDLEECITYIRNNAPSLDPSEPKDREILAHEISKFFADPGRKYKQNIENLEKRLFDTEKKYEKQLSEIKQELDKYKTEWEDRKKLEEFKELKRSAKIRALISFIVFILIEFLAIFFASKYGEGNNFLRKVNDLKILPSIGLALSLGAAWFIIGKERSNALGWPFNKIFKNE